MDRFLTIETLSCRIGKSTAWIRKSVREGAFPAPMAGCRGRWLESDLRRWIETKDAKTARALVAESCWPKAGMETR